MANIIDKIYDNTKDGVPNYSIDLIDGTRLYFRGVSMNPLPSHGDAINYTVINTKTSANGNQYTNIKDVSVAYNPDGQNDAPSVQSLFVAGATPLSTATEEEAACPLYSNINFMMVKKFLLLEVLEVVAVVLLQALKYLCLMVLKKLLKIFK